MDKLAQTLLCTNGRKVDVKIGSVTDESDQWTSLRPQAAKVLKLLAANPGQIVTTEDLLQVAMRDEAISEHGLMQCVIEIRQALGDANQQVIRAGMKRGYVLQAAATAEGKVPSHEVPVRTSVRITWLSGAAALALATTTAGLLWLVPTSEAERSVPVDHIVKIANGEPRSAGPASSPSEVAKLKAVLAESKRETDELATQLEVVRRATENLRAENARGLKEKASELDDAKQTFNQHRQNAQALEGELLSARGLIDDLRASAKVAASDLANIDQKRRIGDEALVRVGEELSLERSRAASLNTALDQTRNDNVRLKAELEVASSSFANGLQQERARGEALARDLSDARAKIDSLMAVIAAGKGSVTVLGEKKDAQRAKASSRSDNYTTRRVRASDVKALDISEPKQPVRLNANSLPLSLLPTKRLVQ